MQRDATHSSLPDLHDLSNAEVDAMPLWKRCCFALHPFNAGGLRALNSIEDWANTFFYNGPAEAIEDAKRLLALMERWVTVSETREPVAWMAHGDNGNQSRATLMFKREDILQYHKESEIVPLYAQAPVSATRSNVDTGNVLVQGNADTANVQFDIGGKA